MSSERFRQVAFVEVLQYQLGDFTGIYFELSCHAWRCFVSARIERSFHPRPVLHEADVVAARAQ